MGTAENLQSSFLMRKARKVRKCEISLFAFPVRLFRTFRIENRDAKQLFTYFVDTLSKFSKILNFLAQRRRCNPNRNRPIASTLRSRLPFLRIVIQCTANLEG